MEYHFYIRDHNGDDSSAYYKVSVNGVVVAEGGKGSFKTIKEKFSIGSGHLSNLPLTTKSPTPPPTPAPTLPPTPAPTIARPKLPPFTGKFISYPQLKAAVKTWVMNKPWAIQKYGHISGWDVSDITTMRCLFAGDWRCTGYPRYQFELRE